MKKLLLILMLAPMLLFGQMELTIPIWTDTTGGTLRADTALSFSVGSETTATLMRFAPTIIDTVAVMALCGDTAVIITNEPIVGVGYVALSYQERTIVNPFISQRKIYKIVSRVPNGWMELIGYIDEDKKPFEESVIVWMSMELN